MDRLILVFTLMGLLYVPIPTFGQDAVHEFQAKLADWLDKTEPGDEHEVLAGLVGQWKIQSKTWVDGPQGEPIVTEGTANVRWMLGNRFLLELQKATMPMPNREGEIEIVPFEGVGIFGFDRNRRTYVGNWTDTMGTQMLTMTGPANPDKKDSIRMFGEMDEPLLGIVGRTVKYEITIVDADNHVMSVYDLATSDEDKVVEITYTRLKGED